MQERAMFFEHRNKVLSLARAMTYLTTVTFYLWAQKFVLGFLTHCRGAVKNT